MADTKNQQVFTWLSVDDEMPDAEMTVMICRPNDGEDPVWLGYWDCDVWMAVEGFQVSGVTHWAHLPEPMEARK